MCKAVRQRLIHGDAPGKADSIAWNDLPVVGRSPSARGDEKQSIGCTLQW
ncbi:hypothetical protein RSSM_05298 [Rhodopirellula sallentina SM41]|uniref:Uncharacterized protein n=1 Tax=Rhodopirellula sallentina SM41 TaxID=1263870 RepID=M5TVX7_9BACT|nr:hypothetical protein RSSM_05298 [Rhodopirellula sallentina SM41]